MFGIVYLTWAVISHIGYSIKEMFYNSTSPIDERTGTYYAYDGRLRDAKTHIPVTWSIDENGDEVLYTRPGRVYRNISLEKRNKEFAELAKNPNGHTTYNTHQRRKIYYKDTNGNELFSIGTIFEDLETGHQLATREITVDYRGKHREDVEFYVLVSNPFHLVRITERQKEKEEAAEKNKKYSWTKYPDDEKWYIKKFNEAPVTLVGEKTYLFEFSN